METSKNERKLRVAVLGVGIGRKHIDAYTQLSHLFEVPKVCSLDASGSGTADAVIPSATVSTNIEDVLLDPSIDIVDICLPPYMHFEIASRALAAGKHVICEKPFAASLLEIDALQSLSTAHDRYVFPVLQYRYNSGVYAVHRAIEEGVAGDFHSGSVISNWRRDQAYYQDNWRGSPGESLGGVTVSHALHFHDLVEFLGGSFSRVLMTASNSAHHTAVEDTIAACLETETGGLVSTSATLGGAINTTRITLCFNNFTGEYLLGGSNAGKWEFSAKSNLVQERLELLSQDEFYGAIHFQGLFESIACFLRGEQDENASLLPSLADARRTVELATALYASNFEGSHIDLPIDQTSSLYKGYANLRPKS